jgi:hypothetical protein
VTVTWGANPQFPGITVLEFSSIDTSNPLDASTSADVNIRASSVTSSSFSITQADEVAVSGSSVDALSNSWTACTSYTIPRGATTSLTFTTAEYQILSSTQSGVTASISSNQSPRRLMVLGTFKAAGGDGAPRVHHRVTSC